MKVGYVSVKPTDATLWSWAASIISDEELQPAHDLHVTLAYDESNPVTKQPDDERPSDIYQAVPVGLDLLGPNRDVVVITLAGESIKNRHRELRNVGFSYSWPEYIPHVTISNKSKDPRKLIEILSAYFDEIRGKVLNFSNEKWEECT